MVPDQTLRLIRQGYTLAPALRGSETAVPTRLMGRRAVLVGGPEGVRRFYDPSLRRRGAFPAAIRLVLFGPRTLHGLDDDAHRARKALFVDVLTADAVADLARRAEQQWAAAMATWAERYPVPLFVEASQVLAAAALDWAGVPPDRAELPRRARQLVDLVDGFATPVRPYLRAVAGRRRLGQWAERLVRDTRTGVITPRPGSVLHAVSSHLVGGRRLPPQVAAVDLLNFVRPTVAVAWFIAFAGLALAEHPGWRDRVQTDEAAARAFAHEVRRLYPFVPVLAARTRYRQSVLGTTLRRGGMVVLDVHGTTHDPQVWPDPETFDPERFLRGSVDPDALVPQGGGDVRSGHRCPGEDVTLTMIEVAVRCLAARPYALADPHPSWDPTRMPTRPADGVRLQVPAPV